MELLPRMLPPKEVVATETFIAWAGEDDAGNAFVYRTDLATGRTQVLDGGGPMGCVGLTVEGPDIYWAVNTPEVFEIRRITPDNQVSIIARPRGFKFSTVLDGSPYWFQPTQMYKSTLMSAQSDGASVALTGEVDSPVGMAAGEGVLVWGSNHGESAGVEAGGEIFLRPAAGGAVQTLWQQSGWFVDSVLRVDGGFVYFCAHAIATPPSSPMYVLMRQPLFRGAPQTLASRVAPASGLWILPDRLLKENLSLVSLVQGQSPTPLEGVHVAHDAVSLGFSANRTHVYVATSDALGIGDSRRAAGNDGHAIIAVNERGGNAVGVAESCCLGLWVRD